MRQPLPPNTKDQPPDLHYNDTEARKYTTSSRIQNIQASMTNRALELLDLKTPSLLLDIGCGSGLSGEILSAVPEDEGGPHVWVGMDISASMLDIALQRDVEGDLMLSDIGQGVPFRAGKDCQWGYYGSSEGYGWGGCVGCEEETHREKGRKDIKKGSKAWILGKKEQMERKGKVVKNTSKYTGRKRNIAF
ncbi:hypothetical protein EYC84_006372 [Monilinia fructicola]|uniref:18S rRNA (guanine(1575)-N(7))-methyltransferase Bud23 C-terminal domain-containing protein n=1 Tax=Monilinia fructicola TaxID=38448 RepID=A0A5M9K5M2_MONFR|nr:hypothetical protein EYC84_006372 [Monilinia fructicola]